MHGTVKLVMLHIECVILKSPIPVGNGNPVNGDPLVLNMMAFFDNLKKLSWCMNVGCTYNVNYST